MVFKLDLQEDRPRLPGDLDEMLAIRLTQLRF